MWLLTQKEVWREGGGQLVLSPNLKQVEGEGHCLCIKPSNYFVHTSHLSVRFKQFMSVYAFK